jgi:glucokinase
MTGIDQALLADVGGTNARFALLDRGTIGPIAHLKVADYDTPADAMAAFLDEQGARASTAFAVMDVAGPIENNRVTLTNSRWTFDAAELQQRFAFRAVHLLNDFEAMAWSLPALTAHDLVKLGGQEPVAGGPKLVVGPGTGFGASCLMSNGASSLAVVTEAGHATLPATSEREAQVIAHMRNQFGHVSIERALSGSGLENLYRAINAVDGAGAPDRDAASIVPAAVSGRCETSRAALDMFCGLLGNVCGNLTLTFSASGGLYLAGGILPRFVDYLASSSFRNCYEGKGRFASYLRRVPVNIIVTPDTSFAGLKTFFEANVLKSDRPLAPSE